MSACHHDPRRGFAQWLAAAAGGSGAALPRSFCLKRYELGQTFRRQGGEPPSPQTAMQFDIARGGGGGGGGAAAGAAAARAAEAECLVLAKELVAAFPEAHRGFHTLVVSHAGFVAAGLDAAGCSPSDRPEALKLLRQLRRRGRATVVHELVRQGLLKEASAGRLTAALAFRQPLADAVARPAQTAAALLGAEAEYERWPDGNRRGRRTTGRLRVDYSSRVDKPDQQPEPEEPDLAADGSPAAAVRGGGGGQGGGGGGGGGGKGGKSPLMLHTEEWPGGPAAVQGAVAQLAAAVEMLGWLSKGLDDRLETSVVLDLSYVPASGCGAGRK
jgi:hypothetical protein